MYMWHFAQELKLKEQDWRRWMSSHARKKGSILGGGGVGAPTASGAHVVDYISQQ